MSLRAVMRQQYVWGPGSGSDSSRAAGATAAQLATLAAAGEGRGGRAAAAAVAGVAAAAAAVGAKAEGAGGEDCRVEAGQNSQRAWEREYSRGAIVEVASCGPGWLGRGRRGR